MPYKYDIAEATLILPTPVTIRKIFSSFFQILKGDV